MAHPHSDSAHTDTAAIILAGGRGTRMGGADKAQLTVGGERFIDKLLRQLPYGTPHVTVSPRRLGVPQVCETPLYGGPAAGIARGANELARRGVHETARFIAVFAVDAPDSPRLLPQLRTALAADQEANVALVESADGHLQPLCALWRTQSLLHALPVTRPLRHASAMQVIRRAKPWAVVAGTGAEKDVDTVDDLQAFNYFTTISPR